MSKILNQNVPICPRVILRQGRDVRESINGVAEAPLVRLKMIVVPLDFSDCSCEALDYAVALAKRFGASLKLLHIIEAAAPGFLMESTVSRRSHGELRQRGERRLAALAREKVTPHAPVKWVVKSGKPWQAVVNFASKSGADLIVMGTHGFTGLKHTWLGSVAERVVRHASCPVLTVR